MTDRTPEFEPERLRVIREARGLTKTELARQVGISVSSISQYESGTITPSPKSVDALSGVLAVPARFLTATKPIELELEDCHFRRQTGIPKKEQRKAVSWGTLALDLFREADRLVNLPELSIPDYSAGGPYESDQLEEIAQEVRDRWDLGFGPLANVVHLVENAGVPTMELNGCDERLDAFSAWTTYRPMIFFSTAKDSPSRRRFDAAHELGHVILHRGVDPQAECVEEEAHRFASSFLLPADPFKAEVPERLSWPALREMKKRWKVSLAALVYRAHELGIYSESTYRRAYSQLNLRGWRKDEPDEPEMERPSLLANALDALKKRRSQTLEEISLTLLNLGPADVRRLADVAA